MCKKVCGCALPLGGKLAMRVQGMQAKVVAETAPLDSYGQHGCRRLQRGGGFGGCRGSGRDNRSRSRGIGRMRQQRSRLVEVALHLGDENKGFRSWRSFDMVQA